MPGNELDQGTKPVNIGTDRKQRRLTGYHSLLSAR
jgi:hypothetical protein